MKTLIGLSLAIVVVASGCFGGRARAIYTAQDETPPSEPQRWSFDIEPADAIMLVGTVFSGTWEVRAEVDAPSLPNVLCQTGKAPFPALSLGGAVFGDVILTTRFKPIGGREDQAAGLIFRVQDQDNYYILRANVLENNVNFYKYASGTRSSLKEASAPVKAGQWQELRADVMGNRFRGFVNGQQVVEATDSSYQAGQVGLWTKADSVTCFDDVEARLPESAE